MKNKGRKTKIDSEFPVLSSIYLFLVLGFAQHYWDSSFTKHWSTLRNLKKRVGTFRQSIKVLNSGLEKNGKLFCHCVIAKSHLLYTSSFVQLVGKDGINAVEINCVRGSKKDGF